MRRALVLGALVAAIMAAPTMVRAESPWADEADYGAQACGKLKYGLKNTLLGWTELVTEPKAAMADGENVLVGLGRGVKNGVLTTVGGAAHAITFPIPAIDVPLPEGGVDF